jgi:hypothetical protein
VHVWRPSDWDDIVRILAGWLRTTTDLVSRCHVNQVRCSLNTCEWITPAPVLSQGMNHAFNCAYPEWWITRSIALIRGRWITSASRAASRGMNHKFLISNVSYESTQHVIQPSRWIIQGACVKCGGWIKPRSCDKWKEWIIRSTCTGLWMTQAMSVHHSAWISHTRIGIQRFERINWA